ncbi:hypothetical protein [Dysgonomonas sp. ZJ709]|nr:hypothetical protein [Dysgonomonas sp. ZJ709]
MILGNKTVEADKNDNDKVSDLFIALVSPTAMVFYNPKVYH